MQQKFKAVTLVFLWWSGKSSTSHHCAPTRNSVSSRTSRITLPPTGLAGDLQFGVAEIGWAHLFVSEGRRAAMDFTDAYLVEPFCFLAPRERPYQASHARETAVKTPL